MTIADTVCFKNSVGIPVRDFKWLWNSSKILQGFRCHHPEHSIANSSLFPTSMYLHSNSTQILALKNGFSKKKFFFNIFSKQLFSADAVGFSKKNFKKIFDPEKMKKQASNVAHNWPKPFFSQSTSSLLIFVGKL